MVAPDTTLADLLMLTRERVAEVEASGRPPEMGTSDWVAMLALNVGDFGRYMADIDCGECDNCDKNLLEARGQLVNLAALALCATRHIDGDTNER